jgi:hypothetical protein
MRFPWHALAILILQLGLRSYQLVRLAHEGVLPPAVWTQLPWLLWPDAAAACLAGLFWDVLEPAGLTRLSPGWRRVWTRAWDAAFAAVVLYLGFACGFYAQFEDFFNYGFWTQIDRLASYIKPLWQALGPGSLAGIAGALTGAWALRRAARRWPQTDPRWLPWRRAALALAVIWVLGFSPWGHALPALNWHALDKSPWLELASFVMPEPPAGAPRNLSGTVSTRFRRLRQIRALSLAERQNLSVLLIILESTTPEYAGLTRPAPAGLAPNLAKLAAASLVFTNHYCQEPATLKSWYSLLTGRYAYATRRWKDFIARARPDPSLPELLKAHGYVSVFLTSSNGRTYSQNAFLQGRFDQVLDRDVLKKKYPSWREFSDCLDDRVLPGALDDFLRQQAGKKFFAVVSPYFPHHPYALPDPVFQITHGRTAFERYQNSLHFADALLGQLLGVLAGRQRAGDTLVVLVSDHGEAFQQHPGNRLHSVYLYEENVRTLFLLRQPRLLSPGRISVLTRHIDLAPTLLDLLGYAAPACDGQSAVTEAPAPEAFFYTTFSDPRFGLRAGAWKYLLNRRSGAEELYNLESDPGETRNLAGQYPERCPPARRKLEDLKEKIR